jgi:tetratricopeptide (TPR) repeat protein
METPPEPDPLFLKMIAANLTYWLKRTAHLQDTQFPNLDANRDNLNSALEHGLAVPALWQKTQALMLQIFEFLEVMGYHREGVALFKKALANCPPDQALARAKLLHRQGFLHRLLREFSLAITVHQTAHQLALETQAAYEIAYSHFFLSDDCYALNQFEEAEAHGRQAIQGFAHLDVRGPEPAAAWNTLGLIAYVQGDYDTSVACYQEALSHWQASQKFIKQARTWNNLANVQYNQHKWDEALASLEQALALLTHTPSRRLIVSIRLSMGSIHLALGALGEAEEQFRAIDIAYLQETGQDDLLAATYNNLGNVSLACEDWPRAENFLRQSVALWERVADQVNLANTLGDLAQTLPPQGRADEARALYDQAIALLVKFPHHAWAQKRLETLKEQRKELNEED